MMGAPKWAAAEMKLNVFSYPDGYGVSPDCMLASTEALELHGAIVDLLGILDSERLPAELRSTIEVELGGQIVCSLGSQASLRICP